MLGPADFTAAAQPGLEPTQTQVRPHKPNLVGVANLAANSGIINTMVVVIRQEGAQKPPRSRQQSEA